MSNWVEFTVAASGPATGLLAFHNGLAAERQTTGDIGSYADAQAAAIARAVAGDRRGRQAIEAEPPISQPPPGAADALAAVAWWPGNLNGGRWRGALAPRQQPEHSAPSSCSASPAFRRYLAVSTAAGACVSNAETPRAPPQPWRWRWRGSWSLPVGWTAARPSTETGAVSAVVTPGKAHPKQWRPLDYAKTTE